MTTPFLFVPTFSWPAAPFGLLYTYAAGSTTPKTTFSDAAGLVPNINPVELDSTGSATIRLDTGSYKFVLLDQTNTVTLWTQDNYESFYLTAAAVGLVLYPQTARELANSITPTLYQYPPGNILRYGADPTGAVDSTTAIQAAIVASAAVYAPAGTYTCSSTFNMQSNQCLTGDGKHLTIFTFANGALTNFSCSGLTSVTFRDFTIQITGTLGVLKYGGIYLLNSSYCIIERVGMTGCNWTGVWLDAASNHNIVRSCHFSAFSEPAGQGGDIQIYSSSGGGTVSPCYNTFTNNECFGGGGYGIAIVDPYASGIGAFPSKNIATNNHIGQHLAYGMVIYMPGNGASADNSWNKYANNDVENVIGSRGASDTTTGMGIYVVGNGTGGTQIIGNTVRNCCQQTTVRSLAIAGIAIAGVPTGVVPPVVTGNTVCNMTQGDGINIASCPGSVIVEANSITMPSTNNGTGAGGASLAGAGLRIEASSNTVVGPNTVLHFGTSAACYIYANGINSSGVTLSGGTYISSTNGTGPGNPRGIDQIGRAHV